MIGRADIEESKSNVAMNAWLPQASYPCGNFSDTSSLKVLKTKGSIGHAFTVCIRTENQNQMSFYPFVLHEISVLVELILGHLRSVNPARRNDIRPPSRVGRLRTHPAWFGPLSRAAGFATGRLSAGPDYTLSRRGAVSVGMEALFADPRPSSR